MQVFKLRKNDLYTFSEAARLLCVPVQTFRELEYFRLLKPNNDGHCYGWEYENALLNALDNQEFQAYRRRSFHIFVILDSINDKEHADSWRLTSAFQAIKQEFGTIEAFKEWAAQLPERLDVEKNLEERVRYDLSLYDPEYYPIPSYDDYFQQRKQSLERFSESERIKRGL